MDRPNFRAIAKFLVLGGTAAGVNWLSRFGWSLFMPFAAAVAAAYVTGMVAAFILFRTLVFPKSPVPMANQIARFGLVNAVGFAITWVVSLTLVGWLLPLAGLTSDEAEPVGHGLGIMAPAVTSWFGHKHLTFRE